MHIIQHLGAFIRYEVEIAAEISKTILEIDMPSMLRDVREHDDVYVTMKDGMVSLFSPEGRE